MHTGHTVPHDHFAPVCLLEDREHMCIWLEGLMLLASAAVNVSGFFPLFVDTDALMPCPNVSKYFWCILKVGTC